jgi:hypothetical protein
MDRFMDRYRSAVTERGKGSQIVRLGIWSRGTIKGASAGLTAAEGNREKIERRERSGPYLQ